ncbi:unnamed protein product, partial [Sphagnum balticum]
KRTFIQTQLTWALLPLHTTHLTHICVYFSYTRKIHQMKDKFAIQVGKVHQMKDKFAIQVGKVHQMKD